MKYKDLPPDKQVGPYVWNHQAHLGSGAYGKVYLGKDTKQNNKLIAIKVMENAQIADPYLQQALKNEIKILQALKGDNVVGLYDYLQTKSRSYIIQMFCNQGDFRSYLTKRTKLPESEAKKVLSDLLTGFKELVDHKLVHRDLKPENILIHDNVFKVADYGFGKQIDSSKQVLKTCCGTPLYMSPQILKNEPYTSKSDVWSMGLIYYEMLFGNTPWQCRSQYELVQKTSKEPVKFPYGCKLSKESQNFIMGCLQVNEAKRLSWEQVFQHPIYAKKSEDLQYGKNVKLSKEIIQTIINIQKGLEAKGIDVEDLFQKFDISGNNNLDQKECLKFLNVIMPGISEPMAIEIFHNFDVDNSGFVTLQEFKEFFCNTNFSGGQEDNSMLQQYRAEKLVKKLVDTILNNNINVDRLFRKFDFSGDQNLSLDEFTKILKLIDENILDKEAQYIFKKFDTDHSGSLSLAEFKKIVFEGVEELGGDPFNKKDYGAVKGNLSQHSQQLIIDLRKVINVNHLDPVLIFKSFDKDSSGKLDFKEFSDLIRVINARLAQEQIQEIFKAFDSNNDNEISFEEFKAHVA